MEYRPELVGGHLAARSGQHRGVAAGRSTAGRPARGPGQPAEVADGHRAGPRTSQAVRDRGCAAGALVQCRETAYAVLHPLAVGAEPRAADLAVLRESDRERRTQRLAGQPAAADLARRHRRRPGAVVRLAALRGRGPEPAAAVRRRRLRLAVPGSQQERLAPMVQLGGLRQSGPGPQALPTSSQRGVGMIGDRPGRLRRRNPARARTGRCGVRPGAQLRRRGRGPGLGNRPAGPVLGAGVLRIGAVHLADGAVRRARWPPRSPRRR